MPDDKRITSERHRGILDAYQAGEAPFNAWAEKNLGRFRLIDWAWGRVDMVWEIDDRFIMPDGVMFGGHVAAVADHIVGLVTMSVLTDNAERFRTSRLETNYFRPLMKCAARIAARVTNASKTLVHAESDIFNADDKLAVRINAVQVRRLTGTP